MTTIFLTDVYKDPDKYVEGIKNKGFSDFKAGNEVFKNVQALEKDDVVEAIEDMVGAKQQTCFKFCKNVSFRSGRT